MRGPPFLLELLHLFIDEAIRLEFAPRIKAALIAKCEIASFANAALRRFLCV